jgi:hypothetical protein
VVVDFGVTERVAGLVTPFCVTPSDQLTFHGPALPPSVAVMVVEKFEQIVASPLTTAVGNGFTITVALPLKPPGRAVQSVFTSVTEVTV